jgi:hypothetical protein
MGIISDVDKDPDYWYMVPINNNKKHKKEVGCHRK